MLASSENVKGFISLSGAGNSIDVVVMEQLKNMGVQQSMLDKAQKTFDILKTEKIDTNFSIHLANIFNLEIQPFMMSWMKHSPTQIISKLQMPILIINGDKDIQVSVDEAQLLKEAKKDSKYVIIKNMNHVLKTIETKNAQENAKLYNMPHKKNNPNLVKVISSFIQQ